MMTRPWYEVLYQQFEEYDQEPYTQNTEDEVQFILQETGGAAGLKVLDVGCGTGRHALALAKHGFEVTGLDLSAHLLRQARKKAESRKVSITLVRADARSLPYQNVFDLVIMLCEGGFSLVETDAMDHRILAEIWEALVPGGKLIFTAPSAAGMLANRPEGQDFDLLTLRETFVLEDPNVTSGKQLLECSQRYYTYPELKFLLDSIGFMDVEPFAVTETGYSRNQPLSVDHFELGISATKIFPRER